MNGIKPNDIAIITPYRAQVEIIKNLIKNENISKVEVGTVDGFQGREKEAILISFVRSNDVNEIGFLREDRRTNVAITRAKRHVALFMDTSTLSNHKFLSDLIDYCYDNVDIGTYICYAALLKNLYNVLLHLLYI